MYIFFFLFIFVLLLFLSSLSLYKEFVLIKELYGVQRAWEKTLKIIWIWIVLNLGYAMFFSWSVNHRYYIEYIPVNLFIVFQFLKNIYTRYKGGKIVVNCGQSPYHKSLRFGQICFVILGIIQIISLHTGIPKGLTHPFFAQLLISAYALLSSSLSLEIREKGIALAYGFVKWRDIKHYHLVPLAYKKSGYIIFQTKISFPLASEYRSTEILENHWRSAYEMLEQYLPDKRI
jgi:hypothetical protein